MAPRPAGRPGDFGLNVRFAPIREILPLPRKIGPNSACENANRVRNESFLCLSTTLIGNVFTLKWLLPVHGDDFNGPIKFLLAAHAARR